jgi:hypothetical protein
MCKSSRSAAEKLSTKAENDESLDIDESPKQKVKAGDWKTKLNTDIGKASHMST